jgi:hypothetical protein
MDDGLRSGAGRDSVLRRRRGMEAEAAAEAKMGEGAARDIIIDRREW